MQRFTVYKFCKEQEKKISEIVLKRLQKSVCLTSVQVFCDISSIVDFALTTFHSLGAKEGKVFNQTPLQKQSITSNNYLIVLPAVRGDSREGLGY